MVVKNEVEMKEVMEPEALTEQESTVSPEVNGDERGEHNIWIMAIQGSGVVYRVTIAKANTKRPKMMFPSRNRTPVVHNK